VNCEEDDDDNNDDDEPSARMTAKGGRRRTTSSTLTKVKKANTTVAKRRRRKKYGGSLSRNVYTFGVMLACAARDGDVGASMRMLNTLEGGEYPDVALNEVIYSTVISACANHCAAAATTTYNNNAKNSDDEIDRRGTRRIGLDRANSALADDIGNSAGGWGRRMR